MKQFYRKCFCVVDLDINLLEHCIHCIVHNKSEMFGYIFSYKPIKDQIKTNNEILFGLVYHAFAGNFAIKMIDYILSELELMRIECNF